MGLIYLLPIATVAFLLWLLMRRSDAKTRAAEDNWAMSQFARIVARRNGGDRQAILQRLQSGARGDLPAEFRGAELHYEYRDRENSRQSPRIRRTLVVSFNAADGRRETVEVSSEMSWLELPAEIRGGLLDSGREVTREFT